MAEPIPDPTAPGPHNGAECSWQAGASSAIHAAAEAVHRAEEELKKARGLYDNLRQEATERLKAVREKNIGDVMDGTLEMVRKHPAPSLFIICLLGYFVGRLFRR
jgi:hypothetical protein